ncbi:MAG: DUF3102 domain-containing protein [Clostridia bacterium]|nr:DUF3102 domain-containing protein [Clostridia bacterium]
MNKEITIIEAENVRDVEVITNEIKTLVAQSQCMMIAYIIEIGRRLREAKSLLPHGEWGNWLRDRVHFSQSTADNYMKIFDEYGDSQLSLFGAVANSQAFGNLSYSKALKLLALPSEEREEFVKTENVDEMSTRELEAAIKERNEAREALKKAQEEKEELQGLLDSKEDYEEKARESEAEADRLRGEKEKAEAELTKAKEKEKKAKEALQKLKNNPEIPEELKERITAEAQAKASENAKKELESTIEEANKKIDEALKRQKEAEKTAADIEKHCEELRKEQRMNDPAVMQFKIYFMQTQEIQEKLMNLLKRIREEDPETAQGLTEALHKLGEKYSAV